MKVILTHLQADFDAVASMLGAYKLYKEYTPILPKRVNQNVRAFLALYQNGLPYVAWADAPKADVSALILTDTQSALNLKGLKDDTPTHIIDHHPRKPLEAHQTWDGDEDLGAITTLLVERIREKNIKLNSLEATVLALGIYEDTGMLTYRKTTVRDASAITWLLKQGAVVDIIRKHLTYPLNDEQQELLDLLLDDLETDTYRGFSITICTATSDKHIRGINVVASHIRELLDSSAIIVLVKMPSHVQLVTRSVEDAIDVGTMAKSLGGGGHERAAAAAIHNLSLAEIQNQIKHYLHTHIQPSRRIEHIMSYGVQTVNANEKIIDLIAKIRRIGHEGYPVLQDGRVVGLLTLRDADRALEHGLKKSVVKDVMLSGENTLTPQSPIKALETMIVETGWGQIPIVDAASGDLLGVVTRTDLISHWVQIHPDSTASDDKIVGATIKRVLGTEVLACIQAIGQFANQEHLSIYLVGGIVRDLLLERVNNDIDLVVEGDAINFSKKLAQAYGGDIHSYEPFGTAKWIMDEDVYDAMNVPFSDSLPITIDFATARSELYEKPTALPTVYQSGIKLDLRRRDFTINTLAMQLSPTPSFGHIHDYYSGMADLRGRMIRVLHSLSFVDDPTRILRAVRFSERLQFTIDSRTIELIINALPMLGRTTGERIRNEINLMLEETDALRGMRKLQALGILEAIHPDFVFNATTEQYWQWALQSYKPLTLNIKWAILLAQFERNIIEDICIRLLFSKSDSMLFQQIHDLLHDEMLTKDTLKPSVMSQRLQTFHENAIITIQAIADPKSTLQVTLKQYMNHWRHINSHTTGNDLRERGLPPSPIYTEILTKLRHGWIDGDITSQVEEEEELEHLIREYWDDHT